VGDLVDCCVGETRGCKNIDILIRGLTTEGELVLCSGEAVYYLSIGAVRAAFTDRLDYIEKKFGLVLEPMTDRDVIDSFVGGVFYERARSAWCYAGVSYETSYPRVVISVYICVEAGCIHVGRDFFPEVTRVVRV